MELQVRGIRFSISAPVFKSDEKKAGSVLSWNGLNRQMERIALFDNKEPEYVFDTSCVIAQVWNLSFNTAVFVTHP